MMMQVQKRNQKSQNEHIRNIQNRQIRNIQNRQIRNNQNRQIRNNQNRQIMNNYNRLDKEIQNSKEIFQKIGDIINTIQRKIF